MTSATLTDTGHVQDTALVTIDAGTLTANLADRIVSGLLVPYGEECRSNLGRFAVDSGAFSIPEDVPATVGLNVEHTREDPVGRAVTLTDTPGGVVASFSIARGPEGDRALADIQSGRRRFLSAEVANVVIRGTRAIGGRIFGAALVAEPAFPSATLLAAAADTPDEDQPPPPPSPADPADPTPDPDPPDPDDPDPDDPDPETETDEEREEEPTMTDVATAPDTLHAARPAATTVDTSLARFNTLLAARNGMGGQPEFAQALRQLADPGNTLFAALSHIKIEGAAGPGVLTGVQLPQFIGELWTQVAYQRRFVPLLGSAELTSLNVQGWRWQNGEAPGVAPWAGNKTAVPSPPVETEPYTVTAARLAGAYNVGREFVDFDVPGYWESFWNAMTASYAQQSDNKALVDLTAAATAVAGSTPDTGVNAVVSAIIDGALAVLPYGTPAYAIASPELFAGLATINNAGSFPYLNISEVSFPVFGPNVTVAGIPVIPGYGTAPGVGKVLVAAREAATFYELPGSPIRVEGVYDMALGGVQPGLFGYSATVVHQPRAIALVTVAGGVAATAKGK